MSATKDTLVSFTKDIKDCFERGEIRTPVHLSGGNEECLIEIFKSVYPNDWVFSTYRSHYHALLKGIPPRMVKESILRGESMHINSKEHRFFTSSIVGGCLPIATGVAMAIQRGRLPDWVWVFVGDMAAEMGIFHECYKYSSRHDLPITFIIEDNGLSVETPTQEAWGIDGQNYNLRDTFTNKNQSARYSYVRVFPHQGSGKWVEFK